VTPAKNGLNGVAQLLPGERDHGDRHFLQVLLAFLRGDDHFRELGAACGRVRRAADVTARAERDCQPQYGQYPLESKPL